jgi:hypothetical protein
MGWADTICSVFAELELEEGSIADYQACLL